MARVGSDRQCLGNRVLGVALVPGEDDVHAAGTRVGGHRIVVATRRDDVGLDVGSMEDGRVAVAQRLQGDGDLLGGDRAMVSDPDPLAPRLEPGPALPVRFGLALELVGWRGGWCAPRPGAWAPPPPGSGAPDHALRRS